VSAAPRRLFRSPATWLLVAVFITEFFLFDRFGSRRVTSIYPRWNDQIQYLSEAYTGYEYARQHGLGAGLWHTLVNPSAQGTLHDFAAVIVFQLTAPSRSAALALNMLALIAWQAALFAAVRRRSQSASLALATAMLPLGLSGPWQNVPGSAYDFRLDHLGMCALGACAAVALMTERLRSRQWSAAFGAVVGITLLTRFLTGTYFVLVFAAFFTWALTSHDRRRRSANAALAAVIAAAIAAPIFWLNREALWNYYYIGHYVGPESAIRNQNFGLVRSLDYVAYWLGARHLGAYFGAFALAVAALLAVARLRFRDRTGPRQCPSEQCRLLDDTTFIGATFLLAPAIVLTLHPQKSEVVISALAPGVIMLVIGVWLAIARWSAAPRRQRTAEAGVAVIAVIGALTYFGHTQRSPFEDPATSANLRQVNAIADEVFERAIAAKLDPIRVSVDYITDALDAQVLRVICYERHHVWRDFDMKLPTGIAEPDAAVVRQRVAESEFVFLSADGTPPGRYPYDRKLAELRPELRAWCNTHLHAAKSFVLLGQSITLYERATPRAE
jgi:hypothetical protein